MEKIFNDILEYIPEKERPDMSNVIKIFQHQSHLTKLTEEDGRHSLPGFSVAMAKWVYHNWTPWKDDVIVASFPKTGTTWMREIVTQILYKDEPKTKEMVGKMFMPHLYLETGIPEKFEMLDKLPWTRRVLTTHMPVDLVNMKKIRNAEAKIICTIRNPKDTMVSSFNMFKNLPLDGEVRRQVLGDSGWNSFFQNVIEGRVPLQMEHGDWFPDHLLGWYKHRNDDNVLFVVYEDMKKDLAKEVSRISRFLEIELSEDELAQIVKSTSFETMKENALAVLKGINFFRKGEVGGWRVYFTKAQSDLLDEKLEEKLSSTDIRFTYQLDSKL